MSFRNQSPQLMFEQMALAHVPELTFSRRAGVRQGDTLEEWKGDTLPKVLACLGEFPREVPTNAELTAEWEHDGLRKQRWIIDVQEYLSASFLINYPPDIGAEERRPAILCWHGHGPFGKEPVMGNDSSPEMRDQIDRHGYNYGHQMAKAGFVTFAVDWIGMGEHNDSRWPNFRTHQTDNGRDWCNSYYLHATMLGTTSLAINIRHGMAAVDFASTFREIDSDRIGVMGLSGGGTMTIWSALCDERIKAADIICNSFLWPYAGVRDNNYCGMQVAPGLFKLVHLSDLQGLIAPRPLLVEIGAYDSCFHVDEAMRCFRSVEEIYSAAGIANRLELDLFPREHGWGGNKSREFFGKALDTERNMNA